MTIRVDISRLPEEVAEALERGETVEFERDGEVTAVARPDEKPEPGETLWERRRGLPC
jgi:hypothetical protein